MAIDDVLIECLRSRGTSNQLNPLQARSALNMKVWNIALLAILAGEASAKWYDALKVPADQWPGYFYKEIKPSPTGLAITIGSEFFLLACLMSQIGFGRFA